MAMPMSACVSAGASLMPSPTIATRWLPSEAALTTFVRTGDSLTVVLETPNFLALLVRQHVGHHALDIPTSSATAWAVRSLSPVIITGVMPASFIRWTVSAASVLSSSPMPMRPTRSPSRTTPDTVSPRRCSRSISSPASERSTPPRLRASRAFRGHRRRPRSRGRHSRSQSRRIRGRRTRRRGRRRGRGWRRPAGVPRRPLHLLPSPARRSPLPTPTISLTTGSPTVMVPVLSSTMWSMSGKIWKASPSASGCRDWRPCRRRG